MARNIPYIHNYCDRWCERCAFTGRCGVFEMDSQLSPEAKDPANKAYWDTLSQRFAETLQWLEEGAARWGIPQPTDEELAEIRQCEEAREITLEESVLLKAARAYAQSVELLLSDSAAWERKGAALQQETTLGIKPLQKGLDEIDLLADCQHVLSWYQYFIEVKFNRALGGLIDDGEEALAPQSDANGSAKIALLAVERSRLALTTLLRLLGEEDAVLDALALLERVERLGRAHFPDAGRFHRPGFDDPVTS